VDGLWATKQLVSKISNLCDPDPPTHRRTDRRTDRQTDGRHAISIPRCALVHRAVNTKRLRDTIDNSRTAVV